ncbi:MAG: peptidyl-prolyl cis-trans isomerase [Imperialibacter sp.]|uniref:peptidyl-prolyl cis-trans isomerase n=1 Tax=Imperialibacter sp. TaxID=2038411 RepID=UPI003A871B46
MKSKYIPLVLVVSLLHSCEFIKLKSGEEANVQEIPVARVFDTYLYKADLTGIAPENLSPEDSVKLVEKYVDSWIKKQLMIAKASSKIEFNEAEIERKVLDYKYALMVHEFEKYEIGRRLNKEVSEQEIQTYYDDKFENFLLKQNIIKCLFVKIPKEAPRISRIRGLLRSYPDSDMEEIKSYCFRFAISSSLEDNAWLNFDEVVKSTPLATIPNKVQFLRDNSFVESSDDKFIYFIKLLEYKISDQVSPLEFIREDIVNIILNKRKIELAKKLEEEIINEAQQNDEFEIYRN